MLQSTCHFSVGVEGLGRCNVEMTCTQENAKLSTYIMVALYHVQNLSRISLSQFQAIVVLFPAVLP